VHPSLKTGIGTLVVFVIVRELLDARVDVSNGIRGTSAALCGFTPQPEKLGNLVCHP
jgi:hypothetical protein